jgi:hypothetical protein
MIEFANPFYKTNLEKEAMLEYAKENGLKVGNICKNISGLWRGSSAPIFKKGEFILYSSEKNINRFSLKNSDKLIIWKFEPSIGKTVRMENVPEKYIEEHEPNCYRVLAKKYGPK